jgi:DoxX-like family
MRNPKQAPRKMDLTRGLTAFIGIAELAGAIGVVLPMAVNIAPWLSAFAAVELATVMLLAIGYHVCRREWPGVPATFFALAMFVGLGRLSHWA